MNWRPARASGPKTRGWVITSESIWAGACRYAGGGSGTATLRRYEGRGRRKLYFFQIVLSEAGEAPEPDAGEGGQAVGLFEASLLVNTSIQTRIGLGNQEDW